jgi:hypothetical protein
MEAALQIPRRRDRPVFEYTLPDEMKGQDEYVKQSIGLVKLEMSEEIAASERANGNQAKLAYAWARFSLVEVDGRKLNKAEAEDETILEHCDPQIRELILSAYADMSTTEAGVTKKFLGSRKMKVG